jgi:hypothetical protein
LRLRCKRNVLVRGRRAGGAPQSLACVVFSPAPLPVINPPPSLYTCTRALTPSYARACSVSTRRWRCRLMRGSSAPRPPWRMTRHTSAGRSGAHARALAPPCIVLRQMINVMPPPRSRLPRGVQPVQPHRHPPNPRCPHPTLDGDPTHPLPPSPPRHWPPPHRPPGCWWTATAWPWTLTTRWPSCTPS